MRNVEKIIVTLLLLLAVILPACTQFGSSPSDSDSGKGAAQQDK